MSLTLRWTDKNTTPVQVAIYRSDTVIDKAALPASPLVTLTAGENSWVDTTAVNNASYHYMFVTTRGAETVYSRSLKFTATPRRGHGPSELKWGDGSFGYFGTISAADFLTTFQLLDKLGFQKSNASTRVGRQSPTWHKYIRNNKILIVPNLGLSDKMTWTELADKGAAYGTDGPGPNGAAAGAKITVGQSQYRVRLPLGYSDDPAKLVPVAELDVDTERLCEWQDMIASQMSWISPNKRAPNVAMTKSYNFPVSNSYQPGCLCAELTEDSRVLIRGGSSDVLSDVMSIRGKVIKPISYDVTDYWMPVLELVE